MSSARAARSGRLILTRDTLLVRRKGARAGVGRRAVIATVAACGEFGAPLLSRGGGKEARHRAEGRPSKILVEAGDNHAQTLVGQLL